MKDHRQLALIAMLTGLVRLFSKICESLISETVEVLVVVNFLKQFKISSLGSSNAHCDVGMVWMDEVVKSKSKCVHKLRYPVLAEQTMLEETSIGGCVPLVIIRYRYSITCG